MSTTSSVLLEAFVRSNASDSTPETGNFILHSKKKDFEINQIYQFYLKNVNYSTDLNEFIQKTMKFLNESSTSPSASSDEELYGGGFGENMMKPSDGISKFNVANSKAILIMLTVIYVIIFFTGVLGNVVTCIVIARNRGMHTAVNYYLFSLAVSDLLLLLSGKIQDAWLFTFSHVLLLYTRRFKNKQNKSQKVIDL